MALPDPTLRLGPEAVQDAIESVSTEYWAAEYGTRIAHYQGQSVSIPLTVIGMCHTDHATVYQSPDGAVYAGYDEVLIKAGETLGEAISTIRDGTGSSILIPELKEQIHE